MKNLFRKWLGVAILDSHTQLLHTRNERLDARLTSLEAAFNSREACKVCGKHRYNSPLCLIERR